MTINTIPVTNITLKVMKKYIVVFFLTIIISHIHAQNLRLGVFADPLITWMTTDVTTINNDGVRMGVNIGLSVEKYFAINYALSTGLFISNSGGRLSFDESRSFELPDTTIELTEGSVVKYKLQYISVPLGLKLKSDQIGYLSFFAHLGMLTQINIKATGDSPANNFSNANISSDIGLFNLNYYIGIGIEYSLGGKTSLTTGLTYTNGFIDISKTSGYRTTLKNVSLRLGILF